ncbi:MAG: pirin family protein [Pseudomonadales bacterium]|jgi:redox-sensitive bicupin YhaK (pirin superfamily)|nr:pirin family protein [Pseudomonadales bacterium]
MALQTQPLGFHWQTSDPFLFCAFHQDDFPRGNDAFGPAASLAGRNIGSDFQLRDGWRMYHGHTVPGFPSHPHRGFETVTITQRGLVDHADSLGAAARYGNGDVQWMTAGRGIQHSEMFPLLDQEGANSALLFQIWLNLPARGKMVPPHFAMFWAEQLPQVTEFDQAGRATEIALIAGDYRSARHSADALSPPPHSWAADPANGVWMWVIDMAPGAVWTLPRAAPGLNRSLYFFEGEQLWLGGELADEPVKVQHAFSLRSDAAQTITNGSRAARILLLQGKPIGEPVANYGPFVMNSRQELMQAFADYQRDEFGGWPWPRRDQVHGRRGRFARHADGREEEPRQKLE